MMSLRQFALITLVAIPAVAAATKPAVIAKRPDKIEKSVWFDVSIDETGAVVDAELITDLPESLEAPVEQWLLRRTFEAATKNDEPVPSTTSVWLVISLTEEDGKTFLNFGDYGSSPRVLYQPPLAGRWDDGWVKLQFTVTAKGEARDIEVVASSDEALEATALYSLRKWKFKPRTIDGEPTGVRAITTITW